MTEPGPIDPTTTPAAANPTIRLWTPKNIFWLGIFLGWPASLVLSVINWFRMGLWKKALIFSGGGLVALILFLAASYKLPENASRFPLLALNILFLASLHTLMKIDFTASGYSNAGIRKASIGWGILIGILTLAVLFGCVFLTVTLVELVKFFLAPVPTLPVPGKESWQDLPAIIRSAGPAFAPLRAAFLLVWRS
jgi:hypothetical protein